MPPAECPRRVGTHRRGPAAVAALWGAACRAAPGDCADRVEPNAADRKQLVGAALRQGGDPPNQFTAMRQLCLIEPSAVGVLPFYWVVRVNRPTIGILGGVGCEGERVVGQRGFTLEECRLVEVGERSIPRRSRSSRGPPAGAPQKIQ